MPGTSLGSGTTVPAPGLMLPICAGWFSCHAMVDRNRTEYTPPIFLSISCEEHTHAVRISAAR